MKQSKKNPAWIYDKAGNVRLVHPPQTASEILKAAKKLKELNKKHSLRQVTLRMIAGI